MNIGVIGCGAVAQMHFRALCDIPSARLTAVTDLRADAAKEAARAWGAAWCEDARTLVARSDVDAVIVCTPSGMHQEAAVMAARAGKHVIVEKPIEVTLERVDAILSECARAGVRVAGIFNNRYREGNFLVKRLLEAGRLGRLININLHNRWYRAPAYYADSPWKGSLALDGGGAMMNQGIHSVDLMLWFAGAVRRVFAFTGTLLHEAIETEDTAVAVFETGQGALGSIVAGTSMYPGFASRIELTGTRGSLTVSDGAILQSAFVDEDPMDAALASCRPGPVDAARASDPMAFDYAYHRLQLEQILSAFARGEAAEVDGLEARKAVAFILAVYESARTGLPAAPDDPQGGSV